MLRQVTTGLNLAPSGVNGTAHAEDESPKPVPYSRETSQAAKRLAIIGALITGVAGVMMAIYSVVAGEEIAGGALLAASALAFGLLASNLDRTVRRSAIAEKGGLALVAPPQQQNDRPVLPTNLNSSHQFIESLLDVSHVNGGIMIRAREAKTSVIDVAPLTDRELEILALVAEGYSNKLISAQLGITERTVKNHLTMIMDKLQASDRTHAVVKAVRLGWLAI